MIDDKAKPAPEREAALKKISATYKPQLSARIKEAVKNLGKK